MHQAEAASATEERDGVDEVDDVIDVEAVARPLLMAHARDGAVEAVAKPVDCQEHRHGGKRPWRPAGRRESEAGTGGADDANGGQVISSDCSGQTPGDPDEEPLFGGGKHAAVLADMRSGRARGNGSHRHSRPPKGNA